MRTANRNTTAILALDPGGSKCDAVVVEPDGTVVRRVRVTRPGQSGRCRAVVREACQRARQGLRYRRWQIATPLWPWSRRTRVWFFKETQAALRLAHESWGVVALAGTGARVDGYTPDGRWCWLDGLGPVLGDAGSAYQIGRAALRAVARAIQHPRHATSLKGVVLDYCEAIARCMKVNMDQAVLARLRVREMQQLALDPDIARLDWLICFSLRPQDRSVFAGLARLVDEQARAGDAVATRILREAAADLACTVHDLADRLGILQAEMPCVGMGSVLTRSDVYWEAFSAAVREFAPRFRLIRVVEPPVLGFALAALDKWHGRAVSEVQARLETTFREQEQR